MVKKKNLMDQLQVKSTDANAEAETETGDLFLILPGNGDWRSQLPPDFRQKMVNKIMEFLERHGPFSGPEGLLEIKEKAGEFEEKSYTAATSQTDYLKKISLKMLAQSPIENGTQPTPGNSTQNHANSDSTAQTSSVHGGDWQEEAYQKIRSMKEMYFAELNELYQRIASKLELHDIPQQPKNELLEKLKIFKAMLEKLLQFLRVNKDDIQVAHRDKIAPWEKQIVNILNTNRPRKTLSSLSQGQLPQSRMHAM